MKAEEKPTEVILNFQAVEGTPRNFVPRERRRFEERREATSCLANVVASRSAARAVETESIREERDAMASVVASVADRDAAESVAAPS